MSMNTHKFCKKCNSTKLMDDFSKNAKAKDGKQTYCRACQKARWDSLSKEKKKVYYYRYDSMNREKRMASAAARRLDHPDKVYSAIIKNKHGITLTEYQKMLHEQDYRCKICKSDFLGNRNIRRFHIDHCHATGKVRGLLCQQCNHGLGNFRDNIDSLAAAIEYLQSSRD